MAADAGPGTAPAAHRTRVVRPARRFGYLVAVLVNVLLLVLINVAPGWEALSFLTAEFSQVVGILNLSLVAAALVNLLWMAYDPPWVRSAGQVVLSGIGLAVLLQLLDSFPFDFSGWAFDAAWLARFVLVVAAFGTAIGMLVESVRLVRILVGQQDR